MEYIHLGSLYFSQKSKYLVNYKVLILIGNSNDAILQISFENESKLEL